MNDIYVNFVLEKVIENPNNIVAFGPTQIRNAMVELDKELKELREKVKNTDAANKEFESTVGASLQAAIAERDAALERVDILEDENADYLERNENLISEIDDLNASVEHLQNNIDEFACDLNNAQEAKNHVELESTNMVCKLAETETLADELHENLSKAVNKLSDNEVELAYLRYQVALLNRKLDAINKA